MAYRPGWKGGNSVAWAALEARLTRLAHIRAVGGKGRLGMNGPRFTSIAWLPLIALFGVACFDFDLSGPRTEEGSGLPEDRGVALSAE